MRSRNFVTLSIVLFAAILILWLLIPGAEGHACPKPCKSEHCSVREIVDCLPPPACSSQFLCFDAVFILKWLIRLTVAVAVTVSAFILIRFGLRVLCECCLKPILVISEKNAGNIETITKKAGELDGRLGNVENTLKGIAEKIGAIGSNAEKASHEIKNELAGIKTAIGAFSCKYREKPDLDALLSCVKELQKYLENAKKD